MKPHCKKCRDHSELALRWHLPATSSAAQKYNNNNIVQWGLVGIDTEDHAPNLLPPGNALFFLKAGQAVETLTVSPRGVGIGPASKCRGLRPPPLEGPSVVPGCSQPCWQGMAARRQRGRRGTALPRRGGPVAARRGRWGQAVADAMGGGAGDAEPLDSAGPGPDRMAAEPCPNHENHEPMSNCHTPPGEH